MRAHRVRDWLDHRTGYREILRVALEEEHAQRVLRWSGEIGQLADPLCEDARVLGGVVHDDQRRSLPAPCAEVLLAEEAF